MDYEPDDNLVKLVARAMFEEQDHFGTPWSGYRIEDPAEYEDMARAALVALYEVGYEIRTAPESMPKTIRRQEIDAKVVKQLRDQFHKTGSIDDAAKLMRYLGG